MSKLIEFEGKEQLANAVEKVAEDNPPDLVVVRGLLTNPSLLARLNCGSDHEQAVREDLYEQVPEFHDADEIVARRWAEIGYPDTKYISQMELGVVLNDGIGPHIDAPFLIDTFDFKMEKRFDAIAQGSLCLAGRRRFGAEVLPVSVRTPDGNFDQQRMNKFDDDNGAYQTSLRNGRKPRTVTDIYMGDLVLFPNIPQITLHSVEHDEGKTSIARLLTWFATDEEQE